MALKGVKVICLLPLHQQLCKPQSPKLRERDRSKISVTEAGSEGGWM